MTLLVYNKLNNIYKHELKPFLQPKVSKDEELQTDEDENEVLYDEHEEQSDEDASTCPVRRLLLGDAQPLQHANG